MTHQANRRSSGRHAPAVADAWSSSRRSNAGGSHADRRTPPRRTGTRQPQPLLRQRVDAIVRRGECVWREIETKIERRNAAGYEKAAGLLRDLKVIAKEKGAREEFIRRLQDIRDRHARKERLIERLMKLG